MPAGGYGYVTVTSGEEPRERAVKVDPATYQLLREMQAKGLCRSLSECVRLLAKHFDARSEIIDAVERAKAAARLMGCERCVTILEIAKTMVLRLILGYDVCRLTEELREVAGCAEG